MKKLLSILLFTLLISYCSYSQTWTPLGSGMNNTVHEFTVYNNELIVGGEFTTAGGVSSNYIAKWNGTS